MWTDYVLVMIRMWTVPFVISSYTKPKHVTLHLRELRMRVVAFFVFAVMASVVNANCSYGVDLNGDGVCDPYSVSPFEDDGTVSRITIDIGGSDVSVCPTHVA